VRTLVRHLVVIGMTGLMAAPAMAKTEIELWYSLNGANRAEFESLVNRFNGEQSKVYVDLSHYSDAQDLLEDAAEAVAGKRSKPDLVQLPDNRSPEVIAQHKDILPLYQLLAKYPISDASWFVEKTTEFVRDSRGRLLAFPFMAEVPIMFYNIEAFRKAGLDSNRAAATWPELQGQLLKLRNEGRSMCPYATSNQVNVHLENLAPINDEYYVNPDNGLDGSSNLSFNFNKVYIRHLSLMVSWRKTDLLVKHTPGTQADASFLDGTCAVLTTGSSMLGEALSRNMQFSVAPLPYYDQETPQRGAPFIGGSALWAVKGHPAARQKASAELLAFLSKPVIAAEWHQKTGFMPLTDAAVRAADVSFYERIPGGQSIVKQMRDGYTEKSKGFNVPNYPKIVPLFNQALDTALEGSQPPFPTLMKANKEAQKLMR
jgi:multiple sugar transport system substrate-binding protein